MNNSPHISFENALNTLSPITLEEMDSIKLMNRIDSKFLTDEAHLLEVLKDAANVGYQVLETAGERINPYNSVYYDTDVLRMFADHHNRRLVRQKVRTREYVTSGIAFLEIKRKNNKGRTNKKRIGIPESELMNFKGDERPVRAKHRAKSAFAGMGHKFHDIRAGHRFATAENHDLESGLGNFVNELERFGSCEFCRLVFASVLVAVFARQVTLIRCHPRNNHSKSSKVLPQDRKKDPTHRQVPFNFAIQSSIKETFNGTLQIID